MALDFPSSPTNGQTYSANNITWVYETSTTTWKVKQDGTTGKIRIAVLRDQKNYDKGGGYFYGDYWRDRDLTVEEDPQGFVNFVPTTNGQTTESLGKTPGYWSLPAGTYEIQWGAFGGDVNRHQTRLVWSTTQSDMTWTTQESAYDTWTADNAPNTTSRFGTNECFGSSENVTISTVDAWTGTWSKGTKVITITETTWFKVLHISDSDDAEGFGTEVDGSSFSPDRYTTGKNIYAEVKITDLATAVKEDGGSSFTQNGTGAVTRTVDGKLKDNINVWDFIPVGTTTASTDCASYFQAAINTGKTVHVPKGTYRIDSTLLLDSGHETLIGDECMPILLKWTEGPAIQISEPGGSGLNEYSRVENFYIQRKVGGSFTCPNYNATITESLAGVVVSGHGASVAAAVQSTRISNLRVGNFAIGFYFADCVSVTVHKCFTQNLGDYSSATQTANGTTITSSMWGVGFYFDATRYGAGQISPLASIEIVETDDNRQNDPATIKSVSYLIVGEDPRDIFFQRAESTHADYGWYLDGLSNDDLNWDLHIIRPIIDAFKKHGIYAANLDGVGSLSIIGGYYVGVENAEASIYAINSNGICITGGAQVLGLTNHDGAGNTDDGIRLDSCSSCSIIGNRFANLQYAISLNGTTYSTIQGNVINAAVTGEDAQDPSLVEAIRLFGNSTFNTVGNNTIRGLSGSNKYTKGINLASGSDNCKIIGNIIDSTTVTTQIDDNASGTEISTASVSAPASATSTGVAGTIAYDSSYVYICIATNTWKRVAISSW